MSRERDGGPSSDSSAEPRERRRDLRSLAAYYFLSFAALGGFFPFIPILLKSRGLGPGEIAAVMTLVPLSSLLAPAAWGLIADAAGARGSVLRIATVGAGVSVLSLWPATGVLSLLAAMGLFCAFRAPLVALADAATHSALAGPRERFARIRVWGSIGFALAAAIVGQLGGSTDALRFLGFNALLYLLAAGVVRRSPPAAKTGGRARAKGSITGQALGAARRARLGLVLLATFVYYAGHAIFDAFYSLHLQRLGFDSGFVGGAWAVGVVCEIGVMLVSPPLLLRCRAAGLLALAALAATARWLLIAEVQSAMGLLAVQSLHGLTFGLWYLALAKLVQDRSPDELRASLQGLALTALGLGQCVGFLGGGMVFARPDGGPLLFRAASVAALLAAGLYALEWRRGVTQRS